MKSNRPRFFTETNTLLQIGETVTLSSQDTHHAKEVLRITNNDPITICCKLSGKEYIGFLQNNNASDNNATITAITEEIQTPGITQSVIFGLAKGKKNDLVCEKLTELGVPNIILWQTERSIVRIRSEKDREKKIQRWKNIAEAAAKQCQRNTIPKITLCLNPTELTTALQHLPGINVCCSLYQESLSLKKLQISKNSHEINIAIGPEGDFTPEETDFLKQHLFTLVTLGPNILRSETAAISAVAMIESLYGYASK